MTISPYLFPVIFNAFLFLCGFLPDAPITLLLDMAGFFANIIVIPIFLIVLSEKKAKDKPLKKLSLHLLSALICILDEVISYCGWGLASGYLLKPDSESVLVLKYKYAALAIVFAVSVIVARIVNLAKYLRKKNEKNYS